jgi:hypothetical protein
LIHLDQHPEEPLRKVALAVGVTERAVQLMVADLENAGYLQRQKIGRQNRYVLRRGQALENAFGTSHTVGDFLDWVHSQELDELEEGSVLENWTVGEHGSEVK